MKLQLATAALMLFMSQNLIYAKEYASVNGEAVTIEEVREMMGAFPEAKNFSELSKEKQEFIISQAVEKKLLQQAAKKEGAQNNARYKAALKKFENRLLIEVWMKEKFDATVVSEKELENYYNEHKSTYVKKDEVKARHIVVETEQDAKAIIAELEKAEGDKQKKFIELAKAKSIGPSASKGGDLGWFSEDKMLSAFSKAAFALNEGSFTKVPVKTSYGYHVIYLDGKQKAHTITLDNVRGQLVQEVKMKKFQKSVSDKVAALKNEAKIVYK